MRRRLILLAAWVLSLPVATQPEAGAGVEADDFLTAELRERVEALKTEAAGGPADADTARDRARTLWDWVNAWSLTGAYIPVNATQTATRVLAYPLSDGSMRRLDEAIGELALLDEDPQATGTLTADLGPFEARTFATIRQTWTVGSRAVELGGGIVVARHFMPNFGTFQTADAGADNYVSITSSDPSVAFGRDVAPMTGMHGGFRSARPNLVFRVVSGRLAPGDTVTVTYGDTSGGGQGLLLPDFSSDRMPLPLYVDFDGSGPLVGLPIQPIVVAGTAVAALHGFAPSVVAAGEPFDLHIRAEDRYYNRAREPLPEWWEVYLNGELFGAVRQTIREGTEGPLRITRSFILDEPIAPGTVAGAVLDGVPFGHPTFVHAIEEGIAEGDPVADVRAMDLVEVSVPTAYAATSAPDHAIRVLRNIRLETPDVYRFTFRSRDGAITGVANPVLVEEAPERRIYWGDTHGHSGFAEGVGTPDRFMQWARDDARLDYVTHSEHDIWTDDFEWNVLRENVHRYSREGEFIAFVGYEWTVANYQGGHHNVLFRHPDQGPRIPAADSGRLSHLYQGLRTHHDPRDVVVIPHAHQAGDYRGNDPELEPLVEIMSQHGTFEWFGRMYLNQGHQVGFIAASDNHLSQPGYTAPMGGLGQRGGLGALIATEKTTDALFDAMKNLATYATTGDRIILDVTLNGARVGQRTAMTGERSIRGRAIGTAPIDSIVLVKNDREIDRREFRAGDATPSDGDYYLTFRSESEPFHRGDNPRGWRWWRGELTVEGATIAGAEGMDFHNRNTQSLEVADASTLRFATHTRGGTSTIRLRLADVRRTTRVTLSLLEGREFGGGPPIFRPHQTLPASTVELALRDTARGEASAQIPFGEYVDRVGLRRAVTDGVTDVSFEFDDTGDREGDYYFVRVTQSNDAIAWSSPIWVGGYPKR